MFQVAWFCTQCKFQTCLLLLVTSFTYPVFPTPKIVNDVVPFAVCWQKNVISTSICVVWACHCATMYVLIARLIIRSLLSFSQTSLQSYALFWLLWFQESYLIKIWIQLTCCKHRWLTRLVSSNFWNLTQKNLWTSIFNLLVAVASMNWCDNENFFCWCWRSFHWSLFLCAYPLYFTVLSTCRVLHQF